MDTSVLINLIHADRLDFLPVLEGYKFVAPEHVVEEVSFPDHSQKLTIALQSGHLEKEVSTEPAEIEVYADLRRVMGKGEASCLAMAQMRGWLVASDEKGRFLRLARERLGEGRIVNTPGLLLMGIRRGLISVEEADGIKKLLEQHRFKMKFGSFNEFL